METYGSMEKREKVEFILEQMRLCLAKKDHIRTQIISKKISVKFFENDQEQVRDLWRLGRCVWAFLAHMKLIPRMSLKY